MKAAIRLHTESYYSIDTEWYYEWTKYQHLKQKFDHFISFYYQSHAKLNQFWHQNLQLDGNYKKDSNALSIQLQVKAMELNSFYICL